MHENRPVRVMLLEDNPVDVMLVREALRSEYASCEIQHFRDGEAALNFVRSGGACPDLAILDINVPRRDGLEVLDAISEHPQLQRIPVVILTSSPRALIADRIRETDYYIEKPYGLDEFLSIGKDILSWYSDRARRRIES